jgi:hypothetical protein
MHLWKLGLLMSWARPLLACANDAVIINEGEGYVDVLECHFTYFYFAFSILSTTSAAIMGEFKISEPDVLAGH